ncbi:hypothetical protein WR25_08646 [Diploscapter pachys]|uniref:Uncharacterized protein n=1 Tax=Diploscapter pachys TaxID=2018661 RepID=A0A2A2KVD7_9BILA|nr:hypothetical protein WR25_08646 [Diploscapter pachys]
MFAAAKLKGSTRSARSPRPARSPDPNNTRSSNSTTSAGSLKGSTVQGGTRNNQSSLHSNTLNIGNASISVNVCAPAPSNRDNDNDDEDDDVGTAKKMSKIRTIGGWQLFVRDEYANVKNGLNDKSRSSVIRELSHIWKSDQDLRMLYTGMAEGQECAESDVHVCYCVAGSDVVYLLVVLPGCPTMDN